MEIKQIYYFVEVAKYGSLTQAAKMLFVTPQALSISISQLEKEYNCRLFIREKNNLLLSDFGRQFLIKAKGLLEHYYSVDQYIKQLSEIEQGYFKVAIPLNSLNIIDINLFKDFKQLYPQLDPDYVELPDKIVEEYIEADRVEACFNINTLPHEDDYESILIYPSELCAVTRGANPFLANKDYVTIKDLTDKKIVTRNELFLSFDILERAAPAENIILNYELKTSDDTLVLDRIASPDYIFIGVYAYHDVLEYINDTAVPFLPSLPWNMYLSYKKYRPLSKPAQLFIKYIEDHYSMRG